MLSDFGYMRVSASEFRMQVLCVRVFLHFVLCVCVSAFCVCVCFCIFISAYAELFVSALFAVPFCVFVRMVTNLLYSQFAPVVIVGEALRVCVALG